LPLKSVFKLCNDQAACSIEQCRNSSQCYTVTPATATPTWNMW
jgi:hypothetical protein